MHSSVRASAVLRAGLKSIVLSHFKLMINFAYGPKTIFNVGGNKCWQRGLIIKTALPT